jgi:2-C-methyl-D-erythritol 2,4-cyclodiphosphate synthase
MYDASMRVGQGFDAHAFGGKGRLLVLGGVAVEHDRGLAGHSDGDVLLHAIIDALLGAAGLGDIGGMFPSRDMQWKNAASRDLLELAYGRVREAGFACTNVDATVVAEAPGLSPYFPKMREVIAGALSVDISVVNVKATTTDGLGFVGRGEGIAAFAVVLLE